MKFNRNVFEALLDKYSITKEYSKDGFRLYGKYNGYTLVECMITSEDVSDVKLSYNLYYQFLTIKMDGDYYPCTLENIEKHIQGIIRKFKDIQNDLRIKELSKDFK